MSINMNEATVQEAVDYAVQMIVKQGNRCTREGLATCVYGNDNGMHCGVGWLLDADDPALMEFEGSLDTLFNHINSGNCFPKNPLPKLITDNMDLFAKVQALHDAYYGQARRDAVAALDLYKINTDGEWFDQWVEMGGAYPAASREGVGT